LLFPRHGCPTCEKQNVCPVLCLHSSWLSQVREIARCEIRRFKECIERGRADTAHRGAIRWVPRSHDIGLKQTAHAGVSVTLRADSHLVSSCVGQRRDHRTHLRDDTSRRAKQQNPKIPSRKAYISEQRTCVERPVDDGFDL
jgi:hypothetical protein